MTSWHGTRKTAPLHNCKSRDNMIDYITVYLNVLKREEITITSELNNLKHSFNY
jgi:hypothetical protein